MGRCCSNCGYGFSNGESYYAIGDDELCEDCLNDCKHIFDIDEYETAYEIARQQRRIAAKAKTAALEAYKLKPNAMQARFVHNLKSLMEEGAERALLVSATGTGKTYAAAFGARDAIRPERTGLRACCIYHHPKI